MAETKADEPKKKNPLQKLKEGLDDKEEQLQVLSTFDSAMRKKLKTLLI